MIKIPSAGRAEAMLSAAQERGLALDDATEFEAIPGFGIQARVNGTRLVMGNLALMHGHCHDAEHATSGAHDKGRRVEEPGAVKVARPVLNRRWGGRPPHRP